MTTRMDAVRRALYLCFPDQVHSEVNTLIDKDQGIKFALEAFQPDEAPERALFVSLAKSARIGSFGFLWCTNRRVLFVSAVGGLFMKPRAVYKEFHYRTLRQVEFEKSTRFQGAKLVISSAENPEITVFESIAKNELIQDFVDYLNEKIAHPRFTSSTEIAVPSADEETLVDHLERLSRLKAEGNLSEEEFEAAKKKLLDL